jgi:hypothetical protein
MEPDGIVKLIRSTQERSRLHELLERLRRVSALQALLVPCPTITIEFSVEIFELFIQPSTVHVAPAVKPVLMVSQPVGEPPTVPYRSPDVGIPATASKSAGAVEL